MERREIAAPTRAHGHSRDSGEYLDVFTSYWLRDNRKSQQRQGERRVAMGRKKLWTAVKIDKRSGNERRNNE